MYNPPPGGGGGNNGGDQSQQQPTNNATLFLLQMIQQSQHQQQHQNQQQQQLELQIRDQERILIEQQRMQHQQQQNQLLQGLNQFPFNPLGLFQVQAAVQAAQAQFAQNAQGSPIPFHIGSPLQPSHSPAASALQQQYLLPSHSPAITPFARNSEAARNIEQFIAQEEAANVPRANSQQQSPLIRPIPQQQALNIQNLTSTQQAQQILAHHRQVPVQQVQHQQHIPTPPLALPIAQQGPISNEVPSVPPVVPATSAGCPQREPRQQQGGRRQNRPGRRKKPEGPPRVDEALAYLRVIKSTFSSDVPVYHRFLEIMKDFRAQRIETPDVIEQVAELLYDSPELVLGFNTFLPTGYRITLTPDRKYVFSSPQMQPRVLLSPDERRARAIEAGAQAVGAIELGSQEGISKDEDRTIEDEDMDKSKEKDDVDGIDDEDDEESGIEDKNNEEMMEEDNHLIEEIICDDRKKDDCEDSQQEIEMSSELAAHTLNIIELLKKSFLARPTKLVDFMTFIDFFMSDQQYKKDMEKLRKDDEDDEIEENEKIEVDDVPGPSNAPQEIKKPDDIEKKDSSKNLQIEESCSDYLVSMLANCCIGEPDLLAATIDFLPYLGKLLVNGSDAIALKIKTILHFSATNDRNDIPPVNRVNPSDVDMDLVKQMEKCKMGTKKNEKLKLKVAGQGDEGATVELMILKKSYRILYERLKSRTTPNQLSHLMVLINAYANLDITREQLISELPKIMGTSGSDLEMIILQLLGAEKEPKNRPENDMDAVMRKDLPAIQPKRGLRDQKMLQQVKNVEAATVCTLGPSYRFMKDTKATDCSGRVELDDDLKGVLNDTWTSIPSWSSEDTGSQAIKKSNLEEFHFKTEDERYELDIIVDSNRTVIEQLSKTLRDYEAMSDEDKKSFKLDKWLNASSRSTTIRVLAKVFTNSAQDFIDAAQKNPLVGLRRILESLKEKDLLWSRFQQDTNRTWRDALDKQMSAATTILNNQHKNYDQKAFKSKPLVNQIEQICEERRKNNSTDTSPHLILEYTPERKVYRDVNDVTGHFFHDLSGTKCDRDRTKIVLFRILMEWLCQEGQQVQIDLDNGEIFKFQGDLNEDENLMTLLNMDGRRICGDRVVPVSTSLESNESSIDHFSENLHQKRTRRTFYGDDSVYMIIRYHHMIQERFAKILSTQAIYAQEHFDNQKKNKRWEDGIGADMHGRKALQENIKQRRAAVNDIRNVRSCPSSSYETTLRELKQLGNAQMDIVAFEEAVKNLFPGDIVLFNNIDKLFSSLAKNIHHATCAEERENPIKLYLKYRQRIMNAERDEDMESVIQEYGQTAEEVLRGKNTYRFEFVEEQNKPFIKIWVIPREEKDDDDDDDEEGNEGGKDEDNVKDEDDGGDGEGRDGPDDDQPPPSNDDGDDEEDEDDEEDGPSGADEPESTSGSGNVPMDHLNIGENFLWSPPEEKVCTGKMTTNEKEQRNSVDYMKVTTTPRLRIHKRMLKEHKGCNVELMTGFQQLSAIVPLM